MFISPSPEETFELRGKKRKKAWPTFELFPQHLTFLALWEAANELNAL